MAIFHSYVKITRGYVLGINPYDFLMDTSYMFAFRQSNMALENPREWVSDVLKTALFSIIFHTR